MSQIIHGYQERQKEMRERLLQEVRTNWALIANLHGEESQAAVENKVQWESDDECPMGNWIFVYSQLYTILQLLYTPRSHPARYVARPFYL
ncbi:hypothetical protein LINGRAHAP2_LOCUS30301 [Linum grandiflorum]